MTMNFVRDTRKKRVLEPAIHRPGAASSLMGGAKGFTSVTTPTLSDFRVGELCGRRGGLDLVEFGEIESEDIALLRQNVDQARAPDEVAVAVAVTRVNGLHPDVVEAEDRDQELDLALRA